MSPQITNENIDHAGIRRADTEMVEAIKNPKEIHQVISFITKQISDLEKIRAESQGKTMELFLQTYNASSQRRYDAGKFLRAVTFGLSAKKDADRAAEGAFEEIKPLIRAMERMNQMIIANAVISRLPFLRLLAGSRERGNRLAAQLLRAYLNNQHEHDRVVQNEDN